MDHWILRLLFPYLAKRAQIALSSTCIDARNIYEEDNSYSIIVINALKYYLLQYDKKYNLSSNLASKKREISIAVNTLQRGRDLRYVALALLLHMHKGGLNQDTPLHKKILHWSLLKLDPAVKLSVKNIYSSCIVTNLVMKPFDMIQKIHNSLCNLEYSRSAPTATCATKMLHMLFKCPIDENIRDFNIYIIVTHQLKLPIYIIYR